MSSFIPGLKLCQLFYEEAVQPILASRFPKVTYSAARLDRGSEVLGFDTPQSVDHAWGPKVQIFVSEEDYQVYHKEIIRVLAEELPYEIHGYSTNFADPHIDGGHLKLISKGQVNHGLTVTTVSRFFLEYIGLDPTKPISEVDWLVIPQQRLRTIASGKVFHDGLNQLEQVRRTLHWYPQDLWLYLMANQWRRINQEEPFMGRCGDVGDELGSRIIGARLVKELMVLCFLFEKRFVPYSKWIGSAFSQLRCAEKLSPIFHEIFNATTWKTREKHLSAAYVLVAQLQNSLGVTPEIKPVITPFYRRPYLVLHSERLVEALHEAIKSTTIKSIPQNVGAIGQFVDSTDVLDSIEVCRKLTVIYN